MESTLTRIWQSTNPHKSVFVANTWQHLPYLFCGPLVSNFPTKLFCKQSPVYEVFWPLLPHPSTDRNETRTWSSLSPKEHSHEIWCKSVHNFFCYLGHRQTHRHTQTHKPTPVKTYSLAFAGIMMKCHIYLISYDYECLQITVWLCSVFESFKVKHT